MMKNQLKTIVEGLIVQLGNTDPQYEKLQALLQQLNDIADEQNITTAEIQSVNIPVDAMDLDGLRTKRNRLITLTTKAPPLEKIANTLRKNYRPLLTPENQKTLTGWRSFFITLRSQLDSVNENIQAIQNQMIMDRDRIIQTLTSNPCNKFMNISGYVIGVLGLIVGIVGAVYGVVAYHESGSC